MKKKTTETEFSGGNKHPSPSSCQHSPKQPHAHAGKRHTEHIQDRGKKGILSHSSRSQGHNPEQAAGGVGEPGRGAQAGRGRQRQ